MATGSQAEIRAELRLARAKDRIHGAYLFEGAPGSGARETARWFARLLLCRAGQADPCETCRDCLKTSLQVPADRDRPQHPDLKVVEPDGANLKVDQIRALRRDLSLVPNEGGWRVGLVLGAQALRIEAANALLKTLEEPGPRMTLLLVTERASGLPRTVRSRTIHLCFAPEPESAIEAALIERGFSEQDAWLAAALGGGSTASALAWTEQHLDAAREIRDLLEEIPKRPASEALDFAESFRGRGEATRLRTELLLRVHGALARRAVETAARGGCGPELERWLTRAESSERAHREWARRNLNAQLLVEGLLLELQADPG
jgi:DNA polymerase-3 subunit delta'